jgi:hypothetical protein
MLGIRQKTLETKLKKYDLIKNFQQERENNS